MKQKTLPDDITRALETAAHIMNNAERIEVSGPLRLGIDLGTSDIVSVAIDEHNQPVAVCLEWADVVRDGVVLDFHGAAQIVRRQLDTLEKKLGFRFSHVNTSYPPGTDPRISVNVLEAAELEVDTVIDEPSAVASLLSLDRAAVVDIGGGTTGVAVLQEGKVVYSGDEATGGRHVSLTIAGHKRIPFAEAETFKIANGREAWTIVRPVFEKMADIARAHLKGHDVTVLYLSGGSCTLPGVQALFQEEFPDYQVILPKHPIYLTPLAIASCKNGGPHARA